MSSAPSLKSEGRESQSESSDIILANSSEGIFCPIYPSHSRELEDVMGFSNNCHNVQHAERKHEMQAFMMTLDGIEPDEDDEDLLFIQLSVDTVYASYAAAQNRVRQYTQLLTLLKREEVLWAERVEKAKNVLPEYKSIYRMQHCQAT
ncbi:hypothetical protein EDD22DRAFT_855034 [Suillus occidentalis]|nr:hypothetical protein EDD22DRAFT_855034 [Suillus occidentalis]